MVFTLICYREQGGSSDRIFFYPNNSNNRFDQTVVRANNGGTSLDGPRPPKERTAMKKAKKINLDLGDLKIQELSADKMKLDGALKTTEITRTMAASCTTCVCSCSCCITL